MTKSSLPAERAEYDVQVVGEKIEILEEPEERQVEAETDAEQGLGAAARVGADRGCSAQV